MRVPRPLLAALAALGLVVAGGAASAAATVPGEDVVPAPPPASYCRVGPMAGWPAIGSAPTPDLSAFQEYRAGLAIPAGATGAGITIADVEYEWTPRHEDLLGLGLQDPPANALDPAFRARDHGTAVLGLLGAGDDGRGVTGLASGAAIRPISPLGASYTPAQTIAKAADGLRRGDVLLVELQWQLIGGDGARRLAPIEYYEPARDAIADAVKKGIIVIEPAGNGDLDVGSLGIPWLSDPSSAQASGAIMVGAGGSGGTQPDVGDLQVVPGSNYGDRVDVQGVGAGLVTTGYSDLGGGSAERAYTACFDGTSGASATVAAAAAVLQGEVVARTGAPLTPAQMRAVLVGTGLPQVAGGPEGIPLENIGPRPQVDAALASLASPPPPAVPGDGVPRSTVTPSPVAGTPVPAPFVAGGAVSSGSGRADAVSALAARYRPRGGRLEVVLRAAAPGVVATIGGRRVTVRAGRITLTGVRRGRILLRLSAPARAGSVYRTVTFRITIGARGAVRVART